MSPQDKGKLLIRLLSQSHGSIELPQTCFQKEIRNLRHHAEPENAGPGVFLAFVEECQAKRRTCVAKKERVLHPT